MSCPLIPYNAGRKLGYTFDNKNFHNVSLGQGQEVVAEQALDLAAREGHWVILQVRYNNTSLQSRCVQSAHLHIGNAYLVKNDLVNKC